MQADNSKTIANVRFESCQDLTSYTLAYDDVTGVAGLIGGFFAFLYFFVGYFFSRLTPWLMHIEILKNLFRMDPSKDKKPRS